LPPSKPSAASADNARPLAFISLVALLEVLLAFATVHVLFRAIKHFTAWDDWRERLI